MRFKASSIGRKLAASAAQADFDATLQAYYARFVAYGHASTEDFARDARRLSILAAIFLAIGANTLAKAGFAWISGGRAFGRRLTLLLGASLAAALLAASLQA